jgi:hypothetical protein
MEEVQEAVEFQHDPEFLSQIVPLMEIYGRYFDSEVRGVERFPDSGPALLVGNHSGPNSDPDTPALMAAWYRRKSRGHGPSAIASSWLVTRASSSWRSEKASG